MLILRKNNIFHSKNIFEKIVTPSGSNDAPWRRSDTFLNEQIEQITWPSDVVSYATGQYFNATYMYQR